VTVAWVEKLQSVNGWQATACAAAAYLLGCFTTGYYLVRLRQGGDLRKMHSGSVGARNVGRVLGRTGFLVTALGDFGKGALAVWAALRWTGSGGLAALAMLSVVAGHVWPAQLRFRGGKGVATSLGALLVYDWRLAATYAALVAVGIALTRKTVLPGLCAFACLPPASYWPDRDSLKVAFVGALAAIVLFAHWRNLVEEWSALAARRDATPKPEPPR
jgi:glycerol-3-phosphate acyltransferase PlsY